MKLNQCFSIDATKLQITKQINHIKMPCSHVGARKRGCVRAGSTVTLSAAHRYYTVQVQLLLSVLHIAITPCMFNCYSLSAHRNFTNQTKPSVCCLPIKAIRHVNK